MSNGPGSYLTRCVGVLEEAIADVSRVGSSIADEASDFVHGWLNRHEPPSADELYSRAQNAVAKYARLREVKRSAIREKEKNDQPG